MPCNGAGSLDQNRTDGPLCVTRHAALRHRGSSVGGSSGEGPSSWIAAALWASSPRMKKHPAYCAPGPTTNSRPVYMQGAVPCMVSSCANCTWMLAEIRWRSEQYSPPHHLRSVFSKSGTGNPKPAGGNAASKQLCVNLSHKKVTAKKLVARSGKLQKLKQTFPSHACGTPSHGEERDLKDAPQCSFVHCPKFHCFVGQL